MESSLNLLAGHASAAVSRARLATSLLFVADGAGFGVWAALLPTLQTRLALNEKELALAMLAMVVGALGAMTAIGRVVARHGSRKTLRVVAPLYATALCGPALMGNLLGVTGAAMVFGVLKGCFDVAVNAQALSVEQAAGRPIMARFQAFWSLGGLGAASLVSVSLKAGAPVDLITFVAAAALFVTGAASGLRLLPDPAHQQSARGGVFHRALLPLGLLAFVALFTEGVFMDWGAVYAANVAGATGWLAPLAYGTFCLAMATGRLVGDRLVTRLGAKNLVRLSGVLAVIGLVLVVSVRMWPATFLGFLISGLGLANLVPVFLQAAGRAHPGGQARGIAAVSSIGYVGFLAGPPLVGWVGGHVGLPVAFGVVAVLASLIAVKGPAIVRGSVRPRANYRPNEIGPDVFVGRKEAVT